MEKFKCNRTFIKLLWSNQLVIAKDIIPSSKMQRLKIKILKSASGKSDINPNGDNLVKTNQNMVIFTAKH